MATELRLRRGSTLQHKSFTGAPSEITVDTDEDRLVVHDGLLPGGHRVAKSSEVDSAHRTFDSLTSAIAYVTANPDNIKRLDTASRRSQAECTTLGIAYPDGGKGEYIIGVGYGAPDGYKVIAAGTKQLVASNTADRDPRKAGAYGSDSDTNSVQNIIDAVIASGNNESISLTLPNTFINENIKGFSNVVTKGNTAAKDYRGLHTFRRTPDSLLKGTQTAQPLDFEQTLPVYSALTTAKICFVGDSLMTYGADSLTPQDTLPVLLQHKFATESKKTLTFSNRSIAGQAWLQFNSLPTSFPSWYTDHNKPWLDYVLEENADLVILGFGMNDGGAFSSLSLRTTVDAILASGSEVLFVTNLVPTIEPAPNYASYGTRAAQDGRDYVAGWVRGYAALKGLAVLDMHDYFCQLRDGYCPAVSYFERRATTAPVTDGNIFTGDVTMFSQGSNIELSILSGDTLNKVYKNDSIKFKLGNFFNNFAIIKASPTDTFQIMLYGDSGYATNNIITDITIPDTAHKIWLSVSDNMFTFKFGFRGGSDAPIILPVISMGGEFPPQIEATSKSHSLFDTVTVDVAVPLKVNKGAFNDVLWAVSEDVASTKLPHGGNGVNHPTTVGSALIYKQFLKQIRFR